MTRTGSIALLFAAAGAAAGVAVATAAGGGGHSAAPTASHCGGQLWRLKTLSDRLRGRVQLGPQTTTIAAIRERPGPGHPPRRRATQFQLHVWEVPAQVTSYKLDPTGAVRLVLFDDPAYVNAVIPSPACLPATTRHRAEIVAAWRAFMTKCGKPTRDWQSLGAILFVRGVGFWSEKRGLRGAAPNGAELYPVTGIRIVAGCR